MTDRRLRPTHTRARLAAPAVLFALVALVASCSSGHRLSDGTLPPLYTGPSTSPPPTTASTSTTVLGVTTLLGASTTPLFTESLPTASTQPPSTPAAGHTSWGGWPYYEVPQLGSEPVRGTGVGCTNGGLGDTLPDGVWNVLIGNGSGDSSFWTAAQLQVDVRCVYFGSAGRQRHDAACAADPNSADCAFQTADWFVVNNSTRLRTMPVAPTVLYGVGALGTTPCTGVVTDRNSASAPWRFMDSWIVVDGGVVTTVIAACPGG